MPRIVTILFIHISHESVADHRLYVDCHLPADHCSDPHFWKKGTATAYRYGSCSPTSDQQQCSKCQVGNDTSFERIILPSVPLSELPLR